MKSTRQEELALTEREPQDVPQFFHEQEMGVLICGVITRRTQVPARSLGAVLVECVLRRNGEDGTDAEDKDIG